MKKWKYFLLIPAFLFTFAGVGDQTIDTGSGSQTIVTGAGSGTSMVTWSGVNPAGDQKFVDSESNYFVDSDGDYLRGATP